MGLFGNLLYIYAAGSNFASEIFYGFTLFHLWEVVQNFQRGPIFCSKYQKISSRETKSEESVFTMSTLVNNLAEPDFRV